MVWGDSHADHIMPLVEAAAARYGIGVVQRSLAGCAPLVGVPRAQDDACVRFRTVALEEIGTLKSQGLVGIVLSARWSMYQGRPTLSDRSSLRLVDESGRSEDDPIKLIEDGMRATLSLLTDLGLKVAVVAPIPEQRYRAPSCLARRDVSYCSASRGAAEANRLGALGALTRAVVAVAGSRLFDPLPALCDDRLCPAERGGSILYRDDDHLTATAARSLTPWFAETARWFAEPGRSAAVHGRD